MQFFKKPSTKLKCPGSQESVTSDSSTVTELEVYGHDESGDVEMGDGDVDGEAEAEEIVLPETDYQVPSPASDNIDDIVQDMYLSTIGPHGWDSSGSSEHEGDNGETPAAMEEAETVDTMQTVPMGSEYQEESQWKQEKKDEMEMQAEWMEIL